MICRPLIKLIGIMIYILTTLSHLICTLKDPGLISKDYFYENYNIDSNKLVNYKRCMLCNIYMDLNKGTIHCNNCGVCIEGQLFHCKLVSKCVGDKLKIMFNNFIIFIVLDCLYVIFGLFYIMLISAKKKFILNINN